MSSSAQDVRDLDNNSESQPTVRSFWNTAAGAALIALICCVLIFFVSSAADLIMLHEHETARLTIELSDGVSAIAIGLLSFQLVRLQQERRERLRKRLEIIADMNHHVRNALQVISLTSPGQTKEEISAIRESVNRIQWALRELLPKI